MNDGPAKRLSISEFVDVQAPSQIYAGMNHMRVSMNNDLSGINSNSTAKKIEDIIQQLTMIGSINCLV